MSTNVLLAIGFTIGAYFVGQNQVTLGFIIVIIGFILDQTLKIDWYSMIHGKQLNGVFDGKPLITKEDEK